MFMTSSGGLAAAGMFRGKDAIVSGPAGGVVGMAENGGRRASASSVSTWAARRPSVAFRRRIRARLRNRSRRRAPARADDAHPHGGGRRRLDPAFRRRALSRRARIRRRRSGTDLLSPRRPLAVTDANVMVGKLSPNSSRVFGPRRTSRSTRGRREGIRRARREIGDGAQRRDRRGLHQDRGREHGERDQADLIERGYDVTRYTLYCFGGAGGQHACLVADALGMTACSSIRSRRALGLWHGACRYPQRAPAGDRGPLASGARSLASSLATRREGTEEVAGQGMAAAKIKVQRRAHLRYAGTERR